MRHRLGSRLAEPSRTALRELMRVLAEQRHQLEAF